MVRGKGEKTREEDDEFVATIRGPVYVERNQYLKWSDEENKLYSEFLKINLEEHNLTCNRRPVGFFKKMSEFMGGLRSKEQCRSHHQKFLKQYKFVAKIISTLEKAVPSTISNS